MCVVCKERHLQGELLRFAANLKRFGGVEQNPINKRSFYLCKNCIKKSEKELKKPLSRYGVNSHELKELLGDGED